MQLGGLLKLSEQRIKALNCKGGISYRDINKYFFAIENIWKLTAQPLSIEELLQNFVDLLSTLWNMEQTSLLMLDLMNRKSSPKICKGHIISEDKGAYLNPDNGIIKQLIKRKEISRKPVVSYQPSDNMGTLYLLLEIKQDLFGIIILNNQGNKPFDPTNIKALCALTQYITFALKNIKLKNEYSNLNLNFLKSLAMAIDARDHYTRLHSLYVTKYAKLIGNKLGLAKKEMEHLLNGALLHDIGKIGIPDNILLKKGRLTKEEFKQLRKHPKIGVEILGCEGPFKGIVPLILYHHEHYDGSGYPFGLKGEDIPLGARIIAVADAFEAMTSNRPYRQRYTVSKAKEELIKGAGKQFDPLIVKAFIDILTSNKGSAEDVIVPFEKDI